MGDKYNKLDQVKQSWNFRDWDTILDNNYIDWLIEQAEKVDQYEKTLKEIVTKLGWREVEVEEIISKSLENTQIK